MVQLYARRKGRTIVPEKASDAYEIERLPSNTVFRVEAKVPRHGAHHRAVWALFGYTAKALNDGPVPAPKPWTAEDVATMVKLATGHVETFKLRPADAARYGTTVAVRPASIAYDKMDQAAFWAFSQAAMDYIRGDLCPWLEQSPHWPEIVQLSDAWRGEDAA